MHIPDGFVSGPVNVAGWFVAAGGVSLALRRLNQTLREEQVPVLGVTAAFIFAAQMINFPIGAGTSGHFMGAVLAAVLLGPWASLLVMTLVLAVQCLLFADGGLTALGANICNMGIVGGLGGYALFSLLSRGAAQSIARIYLAVALAAWTSVVAAALATALELGVSGTLPIRLGVPVMMGVHALIGIGEALITIATLSVIGAARPDLLRRVHVPGAIP